MVPLFGKIVNSLVKDIVMPPVGVLTGGIDFSNHFINLSDESYATLAEAQAAGANTEVLPALLSKHFY